MELRMKRRLLPHHGQQLDPMAVEFLECSPLADETDDLLGIHYLRTRDDIDSVVEQNR